MTRSLETAVTELLEWGLVHPGAIVDGDLRVASVARRNLSLRVERRRGPSYLVKRADPVSKSSRETISLERRFYELCSADAETAPMGGLLPARGPEVADPTAFILELVENAAPLWQLTRPRRPPVAEAVFVTLGRAVGRLHDTFAARVRDDDERLAAFDAGAPHHLTIHRPVLQSLKKASGARLELLRVIQQQPAIVGGLDAAQAAWRDATLIHGDLRFDNVLVLASEAGDEPEIRLVDWEFVQRGDPAWDLATLLRECLLLWLSSMSMAPDLGAAERAATAAVPLDQVRRAVRAIWRGYAETASRDLVAVHRRSLALLGAARLQTAWEHTRGRDGLSSFGVLVVQLSANFFSDPEAAGGGLLGLSLQAPES